jgi:hypothetical protein
MIRRAALLLAVCGVCFSSIAIAADLPTWTPQRVKSVVKHPIKKAPKKVVSKPAKAKVLAAKVPMKDVTEDPTAKTVAVKPKTSSQPQSEILDLTWLLNPLVATSDGSKNEGSASQTTNLVVTESDFEAEPEMVIELSGHVVKTLGTTARIDIKIGKNHRTVAWTSDDIEAGKFSVTLTEKIPNGPLPAYLPVSALAFVTKPGKNGAAMVSLEKVIVRIGKLRLVTAE